MPAKHHWLPAVYLGGFSVDTGGRPRDRRLHVKYVGTGNPQVIRARSLAYVRGLYDWTERLGLAVVEPSMLDDSWNAYERRLTEALRAAAIAASGDGLMSFEVWIKVLVPFVAGICVRSPDFLSGPGGSAPEENVMLQASRWMEMARIIAPLMAAEWVIGKNATDTPFITNDRGMTWSIDSKRDRVGLLIPLTPTTVLWVMPCGERIIGLRNEDGWQAGFGVRDVDSGEVAEINEAIARAAVRWVAGGSPDDVASLEVAGSDSSIPIFDSSWPNRGPLGAHDQDWITAIRLAGLTVDEEDWQPAMILSSIPSGVIPLVLPEGDALAISFMQDYSTPEALGLIRIPAEPSRQGWAKVITSRLRALARRGR